MLVPPPGQCGVILFVFLVAALIHRAAGPVTPTPTPTVFKYPPSNLTSYDTDGRPARNYSQDVAYFEGSDTIRLVLLMLGASSYREVMRVRNGSSISSESRNISVYFNIFSPSQCKDEVDLNCNTTNFQIVRETEQEFAVAVDLTSNADLLWRCTNKTRNQQSLQNLTFFTHYSGWLQRPEGMADFKNYKVFYTCGKIVKEPEQDSVISTVILIVGLPIVILGLLAGAVYIIWRRYMKRRPAPEAAEEPLNQPREDPQEGINLMDFNRDPPAAAAVAAEDEENDEI